MDNNNQKSWECQVCGYIHIGDSVPDCCPLCGVSAENFSIKEGTPEKKVHPDAKKWACMNCTYVHDGVAPPSFCPVCNAPSERFEPVYEDKKHEIEHIKNQGRIAIIGAGIAGISALETISKYSPDTEITLISKEDELPYYRLNLTRFLAGEISDEKELIIHPEEWYEKKNVKFLRGSEVTELQPELCLLTLRDGFTESFNKIIITMGSHCFVPPFCGVKKGGVFSIRTLADAKNLLENVKPGMKCVCIGGGLLGLEIAGALAKHGMEITVMEGFPWLLPRQLSKNGGIILQKYVESLGIKVVCGANIKEIAGDENIQGIVYNDNQFIKTDMAVISVGIRTNSYLARLAGLEVNNGIVVNNHMYSSKPNILAAGDVAEHNGMMYGTWGPAQIQGIIAGKNAIGISEEFNGIPVSNTLKVLGIGLFSIGKFTPEDASYRVVEEEKEGQYTLFVFRDEHLIGANLIGYTKYSVKIKTSIENKTDFSSLLMNTPKVSDILQYMDEKI